MSAMVEKLPRFIRKHFEDMEERGKVWVDKVDSWFEEKAPAVLAEKLGRDRGLSLRELRNTATAASDDLVSRFKDQWATLSGTKDTGREADTEPTSPVIQDSVTKKTAAKKPTAKKPAAKKPAAKKPIAKMGPNAANA